MKLSLCNTGLCNPLSTRHTTPDPHTPTHIYPTPTPTPYCTYHPQQIPAQQRPPVEVARLYGDLDIRQYPSCARVNNPTLRPTAPSTLLPLSPWHHTVDILKQEQPTRSLPFAVACSLSPYHSKTHIPGPKPSVSHKALHFCSPCFLEEMVQPTCCICVRSVSFFHAFFRLRRPLLLLCLSLHNPKEYCVISPQPFQKRRAFFVFCGTSAPISQSQSLLISVVNVS